jgi:hypothetical protein
MSPEVKDLLNAQSVIINNVAQSLSLLAKRTEALQKALLKTPDVASRVVEAVKAALGGDAPAKEARSHHSGHSRGPITKKILARSPITKKILARSPVRRLFAQFAATHKKFTTDEAYAYLKSKGYKAIRDSARALMWDMKGIVKNIGKNTWVVPDQAQVQRLLESTESPEAPPAKKSIKTRAGKHYRKSTINGQNVNVQERLNALIPAWLATQHQPVSTVAILHKIQRHNIKLSGKSELGNLAARLSQMAKRGLVQNVPGEGYVVSRHTPSTNPSEGPSS